VNSRQGVNLHLCHQWLLPDPTVSYGVLFYLLFIVFSSPSCHKTYPIIIGINWAIESGSHAILRKKVVVIPEAGVRITGAPCVPRIFPADALYHTATLLIEWVKQAAVNPNHSPQ